MIKIAEKSVYVKDIYAGDVRIVEWRHGDEAPAFGKCVGIDTETELITETVLHPDVVVLGCFDRDSDTCYIVHWQDIPEFMEILHDSGTTQVYFNIGFDEGVIDRVDSRSCLMFTIDEGRARDMQVRVHLYELASIGYIRYNVHSLAGCAKEYLGLVLDKGEGMGEEADRLTFSRDRQITESQAQYLCMDCVTTWALSARIPEMPTEVINTKGMVVLNHISANGFRVDMRVFDAMESVIREDMDAARLKLLEFGFPDPYRRGISDAAEASAAFLKAYGDLLSRFGLQPGLEAPPAKVRLRLMLLRISEADGKPECVQSLAAGLKECAEGEDAKFGKRLREAYDALCEDRELIRFDEAQKGHVMVVLVAKAMEHVHLQLCDAGAYADGISAGSALNYAADHMDRHPEWFTSQKPVGPHKFFQDYIRNEILSRHPDLELSTTDKSGDIQLTKTDQWRLQDAGVNDRFLDAYMEFNHCQKLLSTYLNRSMVKADGRVHPRFTGIMRTGRTSCSNPNIQNLPSRDSKFALKNMYCADDGMVLCATDFSFVESHRLY